MQAQGSSGQGNGPVVKSIEDYNKQNPEAITASKVAATTLQAAAKSTVKADGTATCLNKGCQKAFNVSDNHPTACRYDAPCSCLFHLFFSFLYLLASFPSLAGGVYLPPIDLQTSFIHTQIHIYTHLSILAATTAKGPSSTTPASIGVVVPPSRNTTLTTFCRYPDVW